MVQTANVQLDYELTGYETEADLPVDALAHIFEGAVVGYNVTTDKARQLVSADVVAGIALREADNSGSGSPINTGNLGDGSAGGTVVRVRTKGHVILGTIAGTAGDATDVGSTVHASDSKTFNVNASGSKLGTIVQFGKSNAGNARFVVAFSSAHERAAGTT